MSLCSKHLNVVQAIFFLFNVEFQKNFAGSFLVQWMDEQQPDLGDVLEEELLKMAKSFPDSDLWQEAGE